MGATTNDRDVSYFLWVLEQSLRYEPEGLEFMPPEHLTTEKILSEETFLIDLRMWYERLLSPSLPGAVEWPGIGFEKRIRRIPFDKEVIMMCTTGIFSFRAGYQLAKGGHSNVKVIYGGYAAWQGLYPQLLEAMREGR